MYDSIGAIVMFVADLNPGGGGVPFTRTHVLYVIWIDTSKCMKGYINGTVQARFPAIVSLSMGEDTYMAT